MTHLGDGEGVLAAPVAETGKDLDPRSHGNPRESSTPVTTLRQLWDLLLTRSEGLASQALLWLAAVLLIVSGAVHLHLWDIAYRHVATLGPLFLVQGAATIVVAAGLAVFRIGVLILAGLGLVVGTLIGFILVVNVGLFGFTLHTITGWAVLSTVVESAAVVVLLVAGVLLWREHPSR